ncbi:CusA/CzcA family heavy metal efflux RND transporter [Hyphomicrobium sp. CS1BSMeth3]|uniref:efflux RND transporter permease subunit n=1 Tax=Hyphomicrobium sp. CS1BSMeth3 TaxID=1892844 RepID=UPI000931F3D7|nr:CusA/CzcA family heavy metal efflux RND transporter [Hyphomicrobium sp. CS1BSMeth3]
MLSKLIAACLARRPLVVLLFAAFVGLGYASYRTLNIEAYPDPTPPIIEIIAQWPGQSPEEVERYVTIPLELAVMSTPGLKFVRSNSVYGLGFLRLQFEYGRDYHFVRQQALNRIKDATLPTGVEPTISPAGGISEIFRYELKGPPGTDVMQLKTLQDWVVERKFRTVPGVIDVVVLGGKTREYSVELDLNRMMAYGLTLPQVVTALSSSNANVGGRTISLGAQSVNVRGLGAIGSLDDIRNTVLTQQGGVPVLVSDIAKVEIGYAPRIGIAGRDGDSDVVTGIVLMQKFERTNEVVTRVRAMAEKINRDGVLPAGIKVVPFYDRGDLIAVTVDTVVHNLLFGVALIFVIQWVFLGNLRCALIVAATIPVALFLAVMITVLRGESANLLSIGAIDLGIIVDATVIMVENIYRHLAHYDPHDTSDRRSVLSEKLQRIVAAAVEVDKPIFFSVLITIAAFLPLFTMQGVEGQIFGPMARTYAYALIGAVIATFTVTPVMASLLLPDKVSEIETLAVRKLRAVYEFVLHRAVRHYALSASIALAMLVGVGVLGSRLGTEFLPKLEEGNMWIRASLPPTISLEAGGDVVAGVRRVIGSYPQVKTVFSQQGRGEDGTDPTGFFNAEFFVPLKPFDQWPKGSTKEQLVKELSERLNREFVGVDFNFSQYIQDNIEEALSGVKGENSVKIFGPDLEVLQRLAKAVEGELSRIPGVRDPAAFNLLGQPNLIIRVDRAAAARYGFSAGDINSVVQAAIGGQEVTRVYEGEMNFALTVRLAPEYRLNVDAIRSIPVALPSGDSRALPAYIRLGDLGEVRLVPGAAYIYRENTQRFVPIKYSVRDRDLGSTVTEAQKLIAEKIPLPPGYYLEWSGEFGALQEAKQRLAIIIPLSLMLILMLLYSLFNSLRDSLLALSGIPFAVAGGIVGLYFTGQYLSVSAAVGFISLFGVSAMDGILLVSYIRSNLERGLGTVPAVIEAGQTRMRQIFMTALSACIGLVPAAFSTGIGSEVQKPLAVVIVAGMLVSPIFSLLMIPVLSRMFMPWVPGPTSGEEPPADAVPVAEPHAT